MKAPIIPHSAGAMDGDELEPGQLRNCPFCGGIARRLDIDDGGSCIECSRCGASSPVHYDRKEHLHSSWNDRVPTVNQELIAAIRAVAPEGWLDDDTMDHMPGIKQARAALKLAEASS